MAGRLSLLARPQSKAAKDPKTSLPSAGFRLLRRHVAELDAQFIQRLGVKILTARWCSSGFKASRIKNSTE